jgi:hypothetical protein
MGHAVSIAETPQFHFTAFKFGAWLGAATQLTNRFRREIIICEILWADGKSSHSIDPENS